MSPILVLANLEFTLTREDFARSSSTGKLLPFGLRQRPGFPEYRHLPRLAEYSA